MYDIGEEAGRAFIAMECLEGQTLRERITRGSVPQEQLVQWGIEIADALDAAHMAQACSAAKVNVQEVAEALEKPQPQGGDREWQKASLAELAKHITPPTCSKCDGIRTVRDIAPKFYSW